MKDFLSKTPRAKTKYKNGCTYDGKTRQFYGFLNCFNKDLKLLYANDLLDNYQRYLSCKELCVLINRISTWPLEHGWYRSKQNFDEFFTLWCDVALDLIWSFHPQAFATTISAFSRMNHAPSDSFFRSWMYYVKQILKANNFNHTELSIALYSLVKLKIDIDQDFLSAWTHNSIQVAKKMEFNHQELSNIILAFGKIKYIDNRFFYHWINNASKIMQQHDFNAQELSNIIYALYQLNLSDTKFLNLWVKSATKLVDKFNAQGLSTILTSFTQIRSDSGFQHLKSSKKLLIKCYDAIKLLASKDCVDPKSIAYILGAVTRDHHPNELVLDELNDSLARIIDHDSAVFSYRDISYIFTAFSRINHIKEDTWSALTKAFMSLNPKSSDHRDVTDIIVAFSNFDQIPIDCLITWSYAAMFWLEGINQIELSLITQSLAALKYIDEVFLHDLTKTAIIWMNEFTEDQAVKISRDLEQLKCIYHPTALSQIELLAKEPSIINNNGVSIMRAIDEFPMIIVDVLIGDKTIAQMIRSNEIDDLYLSTKRDLNIQLLKKFNYQYVEIKDYKELLNILELTGNDETNMKLIENLELYCPFYETSQSYNLE
ncbi:MAG: hypothetical protein AB8B67_00440 [Rickettsiaceae bacterium]